MSLTSSSAILGVETHTDRGSLRLAAVGETYELAFLAFDFLVGLIGLL
jgi:hypothetical protein